MVPYIPLPLIASVALPPTIYDAKAAHKEQGKNLSATSIPEHEY